MIPWFLLLSGFVLALLVGPSAAAHDDHGTPDDRSESPFWAEGRRWNDFQDWSKSEEFKNSFPRYSCGSEEPNQQETTGSSRATQEWLQAHACEDPKSGARNPYCNNNARQSPPGNPITVRVKWHSIAQDDGAAAATQDQIVASVAALNHAYAHPTGGFSFEFDPATDLTLSYNSAWHFSDDIADKEWKSVLRQGDCTTLNIYSTASFGGIFGWGSKAFKCENDVCFNLCQADTIDDGVVVRYDLVTGGPVDLYNEGDVLVHEVGHWLGLYHTFQGGDCSFPGDYIDDTPAEAGPAFGCERVRDTCRGKDDNPPGLDPIHNFMNLSNDPCMFEFTNGQFAWMYAQWDAYRASTVPTTPVPTTPAPTVKPTLPPILVPKFTTAPTYSGKFSGTPVPTSSVPKFAPAPFVPAPDYLTLSPTTTTNDTTTFPPVPVPDYLTLSPTTTNTTPPPVSLATESGAPSDNKVPQNQQKVPPEAKCGTVASQSGYGGAAAQSKDCNPGRKLQRNNRGKTRRIRGQ